MKKWFETPGPIADDELSRRTFIKVASLLLGGALPLASWTGCGGTADAPDGGPDPVDPARDAGSVDAGQAADTGTLPKGDAGPVNWADGGTFNCGASLCLPLNASANAGLRTVGGSVVVANAPNGDDIIVARTGAATFIALSAICTHQGCTVTYRSAQHDFFCGCHSSRFSESGAVLAPPASRPLAVYSAAQSSDLRYVLVKL